ncbi:MAG: hypothetical protein U5R48_07075 [Gammaproteobacteria bacterium]|nr:hypothetical protein [Gammaproteobacteria bacterium]
MRDGSRQGLEIQLALRWPGRFGFQTLEGLVELAPVAPLFQQGRHVPCEELQGHFLVRLQLPRFLADHAKRAHRVTLGADQRRASIEANVRRGGHQRVGGETRVLAGVGNDESVGLLDGVGAERHRSGDFPAAEAEVRLDPLSVLVDQTDQAGRRLADVRRERGQLVENLLRRRIENCVLPQDLEPSLLIGGRRNTCRVRHVAHLSREFAKGLPRDLKFPAVIRGSLRAAASWESRGKEEG